MAAPGRNSCDGFHGAYFPVVNRQDAPFCMLCAYGGQGRGKQAGFRNTDRQAQPVRFFMGTEVFQHLILADLSLIHI